MILTSRVPRQKPMTVAAGLEEGVISQNDTFLCDGGQDVGGYRIKCSISMDTES